MTTRSYKVFAHVTGLVLFEIAFWMAVVGFSLLLRKVAPQLDLQVGTAWPALLIPPVGLLLFAGHYLWKQKRMADVADLALSESLWPDARPRRHVWKFLVWRTALALLAIGMVDPKWGTRMEEVESDGVDIMVALDVSKSMLAEDVGMARLDLAKRTIERLVQRLDGDRIGLVVFAGDAYVQAPLTLDLAAVKLFLDATTPDAIPLQGTAVGRALSLCADSFDAESEASRVVLVITDGENHEDDALARATEAAEQGIQVHAVGLASESGGPIPNYDRYGRQQGYKSDESGQPIVSTLDERMLVAMAEAGRGTYVRAMQGFVTSIPFCLPRRPGKRQGKHGQLHRLPAPPCSSPSAWCCCCWRDCGLPVRCAGPKGGILATPSMGSAQSAAAGTKESAVRGTDAMVERDLPLQTAGLPVPEGGPGQPGQMDLNRGLAQASAGQAEEALRSFQRAASLSDDPISKRTHGTTWATCWGDKMSRAPSGPTNNPSG